jgi:hypothetical protein
MTDDPYSQQPGRKTPGPLDDVTGGLDAAGFRFSVTGLIRRIAQTLADWGYDVPTDNAVDIVFPIDPGAWWIIVVPVELTAAQEDAVVDMLHQRNPNNDISVCVMARGTGELTDDEQRVLMRRRQWLLDHGFPREHIDAFGPIGLTCHAALDMMLITRADYDNARHELGRFWGHRAPRPA